MQEMRKKKCKEKGKPCQCCLTQKGICTDCPVYLKKAFCVMEFIENWSPWFKNIQREKMDELFCECGQILRRPYPFLCPGCGSMTECGSS
jgi:hypothetical protein